MLLTCFNVLFTYEIVTMSDHKINKYMDMKYWFELNLYIFFFILNLLLEKSPLGTVHTECILSLKMWDAGQTIFLNSQA